MNCDPLVREELDRIREGRSWRELSKELGISAAYLSDIVRGNRAAGPRVLDQLGLQRTITVKTKITYKREMK